MNALQQFRDGASVPNPNGPKLNNHNPKSEPSDQTRLCTTRAAYLNRTKAAPKIVGQTRFQLTIELDLQTERTLLYRVLIGLSFLWSALLFRFVWFS